MIVTSNCLEHFADPLAIVSNHLDSCRDLYIALVPYREEPLCEFHAVRFDDDTFPEQLGDFERIQFRLIETEAQYWPDPQLLVVYASPRYLSGRRPGRTADRERAKWDAYYATALQAGDEPSIDQFGEEFSKLVEQLLPDGGRILEAGAGGGQQSMALARSGQFKLTLMDFSAEALEQARRMVRPGGGRGAVRAAGCDACRLGRIRPGIQRRRAGALYASGAGGLTARHGQPEPPLRPRAGTEPPLLLVLDLAAGRHRRRELALQERRSRSPIWVGPSRLPVCDRSGNFSRRRRGPRTSSGIYRDWERSCETGVLAHQSAVIPEWQKGYLVAGLACKADASDVVVPSGFQESGWPRTDSRATPRWRPWPTPWHGRCR